MPELPEAEVVARHIRDRLLGARLADYRVLRDDIVREGLDSFPWYRGATLESVERRGKSVVLAFSRKESSRYLVAELGMTGLLLFEEAVVRRAKHIHVTLWFEGGRAPSLSYWNARRFGRLYLLDQTGLRGFTSRRFGSDPLAVDWASFWQILRGRRGRLKALLMHQQVIAGIGNIYANEILFAARLHPDQPANRISKARAQVLYQAMRSVLAQAIAQGGSSIRDFVAPDGRPGLFRQEHRVYGREGEPCPRACGGSIRTSKGERTSFYCPLCQSRQPKRETLRLQDRNALEIN